MLISTASIYTDIAPTCTSCALNRGEIRAPGGVIAKTQYFIAQQDYTVPIPGFIIIASLRHIQSIDEFTPEERHDFIEFLYNIRRALKTALNINIVYLIQEEDASHFHLWLFPRYEWMSAFDGKLASVKPIMKWAQEHLWYEEHLECIIDGVNQVRTEPNENFG